MIVQLNRTERIQLVGLVLANLVMKLLWLGANELAHDEPFTVVMAHRGLLDLFDALRTENNPPLHFLLMHGWVDLVPLDEAWLRLPSALFSAFTVWPLFLIGRALGGIRVAWLAALLFSFSNYHYGFAHEVRAYALFTCLSTWSMWLLMRDLGRERGSNRLWVAQAIVSILLVYTHFFGWLLLGIQLLCVAMVEELRPVRRDLLRSLGATLLAFLPYAGLFFLRLDSSVEQGTWLTAPEPEELYNMIWRWSNAPVIAVFFLSLIVLALFRTKGKGAAMGIGLIWTFVPLVGMFLVSLSIPMFLDRYLVYAAPGFALLVAVASQSLPLPAKWANIPSALAVLGMALTFSPWSTNGLHPSKVVEQAETWRSNGPVMLKPGYYSDTYAWHLDRLLIEDPAQIQRSLADRNIHLVDDAEDLPEISEAVDGIVLVDAWSKGSDTERKVDRAFRSIFPVKDSVLADGKVWVYRYRR